MCNLYSITTNQAAIIALFRVINRYNVNVERVITIDSDAQTRARTASPPMKDSSTALA
jgi:hypothetical protein